MSAKKSWHEDGTKRLRVRCDNRGVLFAPDIDRRVAAGVRRLPDISCSAAVWRALRRRARRLASVTPCYESVRKLVHLERERRARTLAIAATMLEVMRTRRMATPLEIERIFERHLKAARDRLHVPRSGPRRGSAKRRGPPFGGPRTR